MTLLLAGGGTAATLAPVLRRFLDEVAARGDRPQVALVSAGVADDVRSGWRLALGSAVDVVELTATVAPDGSGAIEQGFDGGEFLGVAGVLLLGDDPRALLAAIDHRAADLRRRVHDGMPLLGCGAGAAAAADAVVTGDAIGGVAVAPRGEAPAEVAIVAGLGLVDLAVIPQAASRGRVGLAVAVIEAGLIDRALAVDDDTAIVVGEQGLEVLGTGSVWQVIGGDGGVMVSTARSA